MHRAKQTRHLVKSRACILLNKPHILLTTWHFLQNKAQILPIKMCLVKQTAHLRRNEPQWWGMKQSTHFASALVWDELHILQNQPRILSAKHLVKLTIRQQTVSASGCNCTMLKQIRQTNHKAKTVSASGCNCTTLKQIRQTNHKAKTVSASGCNCTTLKQIRQTNQKATNS